MTISVPAIAQTIGAAAPPSGASVSGWSIDSRTINPGDCFFALRGPTHDGHDHIAGAAKKGAAVAIVEDPSDAEILQLVVPDTLAALQRLARWAREHWGGTVVGVTGSAGKTTTKDAIASLLAVQYKTGRTIDSAPAGRLPGGGDRDGHESRGGNSRVGGDRKAAHRRGHQCRLGTYGIFFEWH
jgi:UDP-N-acetylmuramoyl-tripeptide--D-alanyl-D-alanine ligase